MAIQINSEDLVVRKMTLSDIDAMVAIDEKLSHHKRREYYELKMEHALEKADVPASLVAEAKGKVVGFLLGSLYVGEFGIPVHTATIDTIGVEPEFQRQGVARALAEQFISNMRVAGVGTIHTLVGWNDGKLLMFFDGLGFQPSRNISLELKI